MAFEGLRDLCACVLVHACQAYQTQQLRQFWQLFGARHRQGPLILLLEAAARPLELVLCDFLDHFDLCNVIICWQIIKVLYPPIFHSNLIVFIIIIIIIIIINKQSFSSLSFFSSCSSSSSALESQ